eukprot:365309-Chlamydomonas_euryale.AAC.3
MFWLEAVEPCAQAARAVAVVEVEDLWYLGHAAGAEAVPEPVVSQLNPLERCPVKLLPTSSTDSCVTATNKVDRSTKQTDTKAEACEVEANQEEQRQGARHA